MPPDPEPTPKQPGDAALPETPASAQDAEKEAGDFIARQVLEKDTVFFEG